jgi:hypothetical protein
MATETMTSATSRERVSLILVVAGGLFLLNAIFGRYLVVPGYIDSLEAGRGMGDVAQEVGAWKVVRYLLWAYSFKLGVYFVVLGAARRTAMTRRMFWAFVAGGFIYISFAYMPLPAAPSLMYGITGAAITVMVLVVAYRWARERDYLAPRLRMSTDLRMVGYFFFAMATYTLCPLMGVRAFALQPERMIEFGLQADAASFSFHLLVELALGWVFILMSTRPRAAPIRGAETG